MHELDHLRPYRVPSGIGYLHRFDSPYSPDRMRAIENIDNFVKPHGGLWVSAFTGDSTSIWSDWIAEEGCGLIDRDSEYMLQEIHLNISARVLMINSMDDFLQILSCYPRFETRSIFGGDLKCNYLDYERIAEDWDAIYLTEEGQWETRYGPDGRYSLDGPNLHGWDIESVLVLNESAIMDAGCPVPVDFSGSMVLEDADFA